MPPDAESREDAISWLKRARSNLALARRPRAEEPDIMLEDLCFETQQAVEKALKSVLVLHQVPFPKTHAIPSPITLLQASGVSMPDWLEGAVDLTPYAVDTRYPGVFESVSENEYEAALDTATKIVA